MLELIDLTTKWSTPWDLWLGCARDARMKLLPAATKLGQGNIFTSVCLSTGGGWWSGPRGVSKFLGGLQFFGGVPPNFQGGLQFFGGFLQIFRGVLQFLGGAVSKFFSLFFFNFFSPKKFFWDAPNPPPPLPETVNARPVRILLECILVSLVYIRKY